jgi:hypothetical protein
LTVAHSVLDAIKLGQWDFEPADITDPLGPPTDALPGSERKLAILAERLRAGQPLWHPRDRLTFAEEE